MISSRALVLSGLALLGANAYAQPSPLQARSWAAACLNCHSVKPDPNSGYASLMGASKESTMATLTDFKSGKRPAVVMHQIARGYTDEQLAAIADWFSRQPR